MKREIFLLFYYRYLSSCKICYYIKTLFNFIRVMCMNMKNNWRSNSETFQYSFLIYIPLCCKEAKGRRPKPEGNKQSMPESLFQGIWNIAIGVGVHAKANNL